MSLHSDYGGSELVRPLPPPSALAITGYLPSPVPFLRYNDLGTFFWWLCGIGGDRGGCGLRVGAAASAAALLLVLAAAASSHA